MQKNKKVNIIITNMKIVAKKMKKTSPGKEGKNGYEYLIPCLDTHDPINLVILMLGTNELKTTYNKSAKEIGEIFE